MKTPREQQAQVDAAVLMAATALTDGALLEREARREAWEAGVRAMARAVMESGIYSVALDMACDALVAKGPPA